jgi:hypothetical protein
MTAAFRPNAGVWQALSRCRIKKMCRACAGRNFKQPRPPRLCQNGIITFTIFACQSQGALDDYMEENQ